MADNSELKRLAEAATQGEWQVIETELPCRIGRPHVERRIFTAKDHPQLKAPYPVVNGSVALGTDETPVHHMVSMTAEDAAYIAAANPAAVLALIAENERLTKQWGDRPAYRTPEYESKRDAMWRRAHMLATSKGYDHINMAIAAAPTACADCMGCGGEWQGEGVPNSVCETCKGSRGKALESERDKLRAEVAGLRTGYEAYERVNAELKAEVEVFRGLLGEMRAIGNHAPAELTLRIDAAMGKGEQS